MHGVGLFNLSLAYLDAADSADIPQADNYRWAYTTASEGICKDKGPFGSGRPIFCTLRHLS